MTLHDVLENRLLSGWGTLLPRSPRQLGAIHEADCELVPLGDGRLLAVTIDAIDEELESGLYRDAVTVGRIAATASLSDLAAVGADPVGILLSVALPRHDAESVQARVARGVAEACRAAGTFVLGGDTGDADALRVATVGVGIAPESGVLRRVGLRPGDRLFASGLLGAGGALAAVELLGLEGIGVDQGSFAPPSRISHGRALRGIASACIDTSDGLIAAVDQLARINDVGIVIDVDLDSLLAPSAARVRQKLGVGAFPVLAALHGEFELVFAVPPERISALEGVARALEWKPVAIGAVTRGQGIAVGSTPIDGAMIRNLFHECDGDVARYLAALVEVGHDLR